MKGTENLQERLKNLPKYSLDEKQQEQIIRKIRKEHVSHNRLNVLKPVIVLALLCLTSIVLIFTSNSSEWQIDLKQSFQPKVELNAQEAVVFKNEDYDVLGIVGKVGILMIKEQFVAEDTRRGSKLMLYFWGDRSQLIDKQYRVVAKNEYNSTLTLSEGILYAPLRSEDAHTLASFPPFPTEGKWQLSFFLEDQLFNEFTIDVLPPFPKTEHYILVDSPVEINVGEVAEISIESSVGSKKEIKVKLLNQKGTIVSEETFVRDGDGTATQQIYYYDGKMTFPQKGTWILVIDGERTKPFKN